MATLKDIGAELGLSVTTVSRALNGFPEVNDATRQKVRQTADRLGYRPNRVAQRLVTGRSGMVGMIVKIKSDMSADQTFFETLTRLTAALSARETDLVLAVDQDTDPVLPYKKLLERNILDGFILNAPVLDDPRVNYLQEQGVPFVLHGQDRPNPAYPTYGIDNKQVSIDSVKLLLNLGHKRIGLINADLSNAFAHDRILGFRETITAHGLDASFICNSASVRSHGYTLALELLSNKTPPTAIICASTLVAEGVMDAIRDRGLKVPDDLSVIAHDDALPLTHATSFNPALTVTQAPLRDACKPLANMLIDYLNGTPLEDLQVLLNAELIVRHSTGPAPKDLK